MLFYYRQHPTFVLDFLDAECFIKEENSRDENQEHIEDVETDRNLQQYDW